jgi:hypothetical protein
MSIFDPKTGTIRGAMSSRRDPVRTGEFFAIITPFERRDENPAREYWGQFEMRRINSQKTGLEYVLLQVPMKIDDPRAAEDNGRVVRYDMFLDLDENGNPDCSPGKNTALGGLREAISQNEDDMEWHPDHMIGHRLLSRVTHRTAEDGRVFDQVSDVASPK